MSTLDPEVSPMSVEKGPTKGGVVLIGMLALGGAMAIVRDGPIVDIVGGVALLLCGTMIGLTAPRSRP